MTTKEFLISKFEKKEAVIGILGLGYDDIKVIGILDEDIEVIGRHINGVKVLGGWQDRESIFSRYNISELWYATSDSLIDESEVENWVEMQGCKHRTTSKI